MRPSNAGGVALLWVALFTTGAAAADAPVPLADPPIGGGVSPVLVAPLGGSAPVASDLGVGLGVDMRITWRVSHRFAAFVEGDYVGYWTEGATTKSFAPGSVIRTSTPKVGDAMFGIRYWPVRMFFVEHTIGYNSSSLVRVRDLSTSPAREQNPMDFMNDVPEAEGIVWGWGAGLWLPLLRKDAVTFALTVEAGLRVALFLTTASVTTLVTLPTSVGIELRGF